MQYEDYGWLAVASVVVAVDGMAPRNRTLSHGFAKYRRRRPIVTAVVAGGLIAHLYGKLPASVDPLHRVAVWLGKSD